jgi:beta-N-acetylhexosaminidase
MRKLYIYRLILAIIVLMGLSPIQGGNSAPEIQTYDQEARAQEILDKMTPEDRVGQMFLVTFKGTDVGSETQINDLVINHQIGGVVLLAENDNFTATNSNLYDLWALINQLQVSKYANSQNTSDEIGTDSSDIPIYIPLFVGISQEGDGYPNDQILNGLTPLPSQLSIGATWNTDLARQVGEVLGEELSALGINLLFGPSLDVLENPLLKGASQIGNRSFGGDPYWVGEMGRSYIRGVHEGSDNRMIVVGTHFPGLGSADHVPEEEVATVRKSLEQLKQIELAPFFTVTGNAITQTEKVDALLTSHIRYQGLQGNIRSTTRPIGFDQQALSLLMELSPFASWRDGGGVMISDDLGSRAVRRFYDPTEQEFNARRLALDAFLAGNDLLYLNNFIETNDPDTYTTIIRTLEFFTQKFNEDPLFAERVNQSVLRLLKLKLHIYDYFDLNQVLTSGNLNQLGNSSQVTFDVAQKSATLISPTISELDTVLPEIPGRNEFIVFFTDNYLIKQCSDCPEKPILDPNSLSEAVMNSYGPRAGGLVSQYYLRSYSFSQLLELLNGDENSEPLLLDLNRTNWIVFTMLDVDEERPSSLALSRFLAERPDLISNKKVIVFSMNAPNYLDSTDISKLTAYFGLFSKSPPFIDIAARVLFKEISKLSGALPVSVPGVGYDLILATSPDPDQVIPLLLDIPEWTDTEGGTSLDTLPLPQYRIGDSIPLKTGIILDSNTHPVPNNTPIQFNITINGEEAPPILKTTVDGVTQAKYIIQQSGTLAIQVVSGSAISNVLTFEIPVEETTPEPTQTTVTEIPPTPVPTPEFETNEVHTGLEKWLGALVVASFIGWGASRTGSLIGKTRLGIRWGLSAFIGGLIFYTYAILELPGSVIITTISSTWGLPLATLIGAVTGWLCAILLSIGSPK